MTAHRDKRQLLERIRELRKLGKSWREIGRELMLSHERCRQLYSLEDEGPLPQD
jgi:orotate phosphoribosyltransferase-like protein